MNMKAMAAAPLAALVLLGSGAAVQAQNNTRWMSECAGWVAKKGYSVDYIEQRTGERPSGNMAQNWRSNLEPKEARAGDVVFLYVASADGNGQRAEIVEDVLRNEDGSIRGFRTSSMNLGKMVEPHCHITENFGKVSMRRVEFDRVLRAYRPPGK